MSIGWGQNWPSMLFWPNWPTMHSHWDDNLCRLICKNERHGQLMILFVKWNRKWGQLNIFCFFSLRFLEHCQVTGTFNVFYVLPKRKECKIKYGMLVFQISMWWPAQRLEKKKLSVLGKTEVMLKVNITKQLLMTSCWVLLCQKHLQCYGLSGPSSTGHVHSL